MFPSLGTILGLRVGPFAIQVQMLQYAQKVNFLSDSCEKILQKVCEMFLFTIFSKG